MNAQIVLLLVHLLCSTESWVVNTWLADLWWIFYHNYHTVHAEIETISQLWWSYYVCKLSVFRDIYIQK